MSAIKFLLMVLLALATNVYAKYEKEVVELEYISKNYTSGYCDFTILKDIYGEEIVHKSHLMALNEAISFSLKGDNIINGWIGNFKIFKVGKTVNPEFEKLIIFANNPDIKKQLQADFDATREKIRSTDSLIESVLKRPQIFKNLKSQYVESLGPTTTDALEESFNKEVHRLIFRPILCPIYEMVLVKDSPGGRLISDYYRSTFQIYLYQFLEGKN